MPTLFVSASTRAELAWVDGRLDPSHPDTIRVLRVYEDRVSQIEPVNVLVPDQSDWIEAGILAGKAARAIVGRGGRISTAFDRVELISDAITAVVAVKAEVTIITEDANFDILAQLLPGLRVLFYDRLK